MIVQNKTNCLLCGCTSELNYAAYPGYQIPSVYEIYYCDNCNTSFSIPREESNSIYELIYKNGKRVRWYERYWSYANSVKNKNRPLDFLAESEDIYWGVKESLNQIILETKVSPKILEIGCGLGYMTYSLNKQGFNTLGLDISIEAVNQAIKNYGNYFICANLSEYAIIHQNEYDLILFTEVIEHLNEITSFMESIKKLLTNGGHIILTTPNKSFYPNRIIWATDLPPVHCWWFSEESIKFIAQSLDMDVKFLDFQNYYSKNLNWIDLSKISIPITPPVFDIFGKLIFTATIVSKIRNRIKKNLIKVKMIKRVFTLLKYLPKRNKPNILLARNRGPVICAILQ